MTVKRKPKKCPNFVPVPGTEGRQEHCKISRGGDTFRVVRYRKTGNLVAWLQPKGKPSYPGMELPVSTPQTRSLKHLVDEASRFVRRGRRPMA